MPEDPPLSEPSPPMDYASAAKRKSGLATASMVLGIVSIPMVILLFSGAAVGLVAIGLGIGALVRIRRWPDVMGRTPALVGIITGCVAILLASACYAWLGNI